jgi:hypothetical protein
MTQIGLPRRRKTVATPAVSTVATHGTSYRERRASIRGSRPSSDSCDSVREAPASGCSVPWNMLSTMNQIAAAFAAPPRSGANVGPSVRISSPSIGFAPSAPSQITGSAMKYREAMPPEANIARGRLRTGSFISPTWQAAASNAGAAKPIR